MTRTKTKTDDRLLTGPEVAELISEMTGQSFKASTWRSYKRSGRTPPPDDEGDPTLPANRRIQRWLESTVRRWQAGRPTAGVNGWAWRDGDWVRTGEISPRPGMALGWQQGELLLAIDTDPKPVAELREQVGGSRPNFSARLRSLEQRRGFITVERSERGVAETVSLTEAGRQEQARLRALDLVPTADAE